MPSFEPTAQAAQLCLDRVQPDDYARTRNSLDGAVTRLSPYITHGFLNLTDVYTAVHARHPLHPKHKLVFELGWRAYFRQVWAHLGDGIVQSLHTGLLPDDSYQAEMPTDVLTARTGIPAIDLTVRELYETGYVHNHARMWLASYLVHLRKVHWRAGAQWMLGHLLDGDLASNHLSWQWVAGTSSSKPYLFNADNVASYAPQLWHSPGSAIDVSYELMDTLARGTQPICAQQDARRADDGVAAPDLCGSPLESRSDGLWCAPTASSQQHLAGRDVWLHHPWSLGTGPTTLATDVLRIGVGIESCHSQTPWNQRRWDFVTLGLRAQTHPLFTLWWGSVEHIAEALKSAKSVHWQSDPHIDPALARLQTLLHAIDPHCVTGPHSTLSLFEPVNTYCRSFSEWWKRTGINDAHTTG